MRKNSDILKNLHSRKLFLSFFVLFLLPLGAIGVVILSSLHSSFCIQAMNEQLKDTVIVMDHVQLWATSFDRIITQIISDKNFKPDKLNYHSEQKILQENLTLLGASHEGLDNIWYKLPTDERFISGDDSLLVTRMNSQRYVRCCDEKEEMKIYERLVLGDIVPLYDRQKGHKCLMIPYDFFLVNRMNTQKEMIIFQLNLQVIENELNSLLGTRQGAVRLRDAWGNILISQRNNFDGEYFVSAISQYNKAKEYISEQKYKGGMLFGIPIISTSVSAQYWAIDLILQNDLVGRFGLIPQVALLLITIFILGCIIFIVLIIRLYLPIRSIRHSIQNNTALDDEETSDDYEYIESSIERINKDNLQLQKNIEKARDFVASTLFSGRIHDLIDFKHKYGFCGIIPPDESYSILAVDISTVPLDIIIKSLNFPQNIYFTQFSNSCVTLYFTGSERPKIVDASLRIGISEVGHSMNQTAIFCAQAWFALTMKTCTFSQELIEAGITLSPECKDTFNSVVQSGFISELIDFFINVPNDKLYDSACSLSACLLGFISSIPSVIIEDSSIFYIREGLSNVELKNVTNNLVSLLTDLITPEKKEEGCLIDQMYYYIAKNFDDPSFSVKQMASDFSLSMSALSGYFKKNAGILLSEYITEKKMNRAMHLLEFSNLSIQEVGLAIGYFNVTSFTRRFHQMTSMSPIEYRTIRREEAPK